MMFDISLHVVFRLHLEGNNTRKKNRFDDICIKTKHNNYAIMNIIMGLRTILFAQFA